MAVTSGRGVARGHAYSDVPSGRRDADVSSGLRVHRLDAPGGLYQSNGAVIRAGARQGARQARAASRMAQPTVRCGRGGGQQVIAGAFGALAPSWLRAARRAGKTLGAWRLCGDV